MSDASVTARTLALLSLLQTRKYWSGTELAERLGVSGRTLRRDIEHLRELDYRVSAVRGVAGGYQLDAGSDLPPLIFTSEEAVALAVSLLSAAAHSSVAGIADTNVAVLAKLEQVLPARLRTRVSALLSATASAGPISDTTVDAETLSLLALASRDSETVRFDYIDGAGTGSRRHVEPLQLVQHGARWYLVCWDLDRGDWRTFRVDRIRSAAPTRRRFVPRELFAADAAAFVTAQLKPARTVAATVRIDAPHREAVAHLGGFTSGLVAHGATQTDWTISSERVEVLAAALVWVPWPFAVLDCPELSEFLDGFAGRVARGRRVSGPQ
jgi:predicted DNA-binding transcriptional regulator YafY